MTSFTMGYTKVRGPEHRRDKRMSLPVFAVRIGGQICDTLNWSLGGLLIENYDGVVVADKPLEIEIKIKDEHAEFEMKIAAKVVRHDLKTRRLAVKFEALSPTIYDFFERGFSRRFHRRDHETT